MSDEETIEEEPKKGGKLKLILLIGLPVLVLLLGGGGVAYFMGLGPAASATTEDAEPDESQADLSNVAFVDLPDLLVNLSGSGRRLRFLKIAAALEVDGEDEAEIVRRFVPRILDSFHVYLRAISPEELEGSEGVYRIKEELLARTNDAIRPAQVRDVLIREMLVQ